MAISTIFEYLTAFSNVFVLNDPQHLNLQVTFSCFKKTYDMICFFVRVSS